MWTEITRRHYERPGLRYASDLTDAEWTVIAPHLPAHRRHGFVDYYYNNRRCHEALDNVTPADVYF